MMTARVTLVARATTTLMVMTADEGDGKGKEGPGQ
jgi:hypothetical protein